MKKIFLIILATLSVYSCKKEQVYTDSLNNTINAESKKNDVRFKIQGTYALNCIFGFGSSSGNDEYGGYDATINMSPYKNRYIITPLKLTNSGGTKSNGNFVISIDPTGIITLENILNYSDYVAYGSGTMDTVTNTIQFNLNSDFYRCNCTGKKK